jgi:small multidrug resistance pump
VPVPPPRSSPQGGGGSKAAGKGRSFHDHDKVNVTSRLEIALRSVSIKGLIMPAYLYLGIAILSEVIATSALRASDGFSRLMPSVIVIVGYVISFYFLSLTLKVIPVGIAYAIWSGTGIVLISSVAWLFFGQKLDAAALIGIGLIMAGVIVINAFSNSAAH